jgi:eukaryotic-like serine/threonine-protein kinase
MIETLGRYKILSTIGTGAMGVVYKAVDPVIDRTVAIKTVNLALSSDEIAEYEARFQQEIKAAGKLNHPNIVTIYDVGRNDSFAYMAMEFLEGREIKEILATGERPLVADAVSWICQSARGLASAHDYDIIHRDVKPSNIMVIKGGVAKITDFGIARMTSSSVKTMTGLILGSPRYMSPEQVIGRSLDYRTDIFSLGVVLYETLTGVPPFDGDNVNAIMYATVNTAPPPPSSHNPNVPPMLDLIVAKATAKAADERYQSMREFAHDLEEVRRQLSGNASRSFVAQNVPSQPMPPSLESLGIGRFQKTPENEVGEVKPLRLAKDFDSFEATVKLAAMTNQTAQFQKYITDTQKLRAYTGVGSGANTATGTVAGTEAGSSASTAPSSTQTVRANATAHASTQASAKASSKPRPKPTPAPRYEPTNNWIAVAVIVMMAGMIIALAIALLLR